ASGSPPRRTVPRGSAAEPPPPRKPGRRYSACRRTRTWGLLLVVPVTGSGGVAGVGRLRLSGALQGRERFPSQQRVQGDNDIAEEEQQRGKRLDAEGVNFGCGRPQSGKNAGKEQREAGK